MWKVSGASGPVSPLRCGTPSTELYLGVAVALQKEIAMCSHNVLRKFVIWYWAAFIAVRGPQAGCNCNVIQCGLIQCDKEVDRKG